MTTDKPTPELLPCPFCGGEACTKEWTVGSHDQIKIWCDSEHCEVYPSVFGNKISKIIAWNTRPSELRQAGVDGAICEGMMHCAKCKFVLNRVTLTPQGAFCGDNKTEPCPNGCGPLWPMTWKQRALEAEEAHYKLLQTERCKNHPEKAMRANLDGDNLCQEYCDKWVQGEGAALQPAAQKTEGADCCDVDLSETVWHDKYHTLCEQSWKALGISEYTGLSIPEHIAALASRASVDVEALKRETVENTVGKFHSYGATRRDAEHWIKMAIDRLAETGRLHASHTGGKTE